MTKLGYLGLSVFLDSLLIFTSTKIQLITLLVADKSYVAKTYINIVRYCNIKHYQTAVDCQYDLALTTVEELGDKAQPMHERIFSYDLF